VALVGVTLFRVVGRRAPSHPVVLGLQLELLSGSPVFVLPNPSGRNAHFSYAGMLQVYRQLADLLERLSRSRGG
jgi:TDG/mug DNA glycosylase family protein